MTATDSVFWNRFAKTTGHIGCLAFLLVFFAATVDGAFDWRVFFLAGTALFLCWSRIWVLVPIHLRHANAEDEMWQRFFESDWKYVNATAGMSGVELDELRALFRAADDVAVRCFIRNKLPNLTSEQVQDYIRFFNDEFMDTVSAFIDEDGRLRGYDL